MKKLWIISILFMVQVINGYEQEKTESFNKEVN